jgi:hypothetical protein
MIWVTFWCRNVLLKCYPAIQLHSYNACHAIETTHPPKAWHKQAPNGSRSCCLHSPGDQRAPGVPSELISSTLNACYPHDAAAPPPQAIVADGRAGGASTSRRSLLCCIHRRLHTVPPLLPPYPQRSAPPRPARACRQQQSTSSWCATARPTSTQRGGCRGRCRRGRRSTRRGGGRRAR